MSLSSIVAHITALPVATPLGTAAVLAALNKFLPRRMADTLAILATLVTLFTETLLLYSVRSQPFVYWYGGWAPRSGAALGICFVIDPLSCALAMLISVLVLVAFVFSLRYFDSIGTMFHVLVLGFLAAMSGFAFTGDLFNLFVFFELMSASAFALCGYKNEETTAQQGALNFAITNTIGAFLVLCGIAMLYSRTGALNMAQIGRALGQQSDATVITAFVFLLVGFYVKAAIFPFHFWLADAHAVAPTPVCILFSGIMVQLGVYAVARVYWAIMAGPFAAHRGALMSLLLVIGTITSLLGAIMCFGQRHLKRLLAFSTISHTGLLVIGFALLDPHALSGVALYVAGHGLVKASLFIGAGILLHRYGSVDELELRGRAQRHHFSGIVFLLGALGLAGVPPNLTFLGEHAIDHAATLVHQDWIPVIFAFSGAITSAAVLRVYGRVYLGWGDRESLRTGKQIPEERETAGPHHRIPAVMILPAFLMVIAALGLTLTPKLRRAAETGAFTMADTAAYQSRVLDGAHLPNTFAPPGQTALTPTLISTSCAIVFGLLLAAWSLSPLWPKQDVIVRPFKLVMGGLRSLHSGHVGDYVAFLTLGAAAIGIVLGLLIRRFGM
ncbi:MAG TPA: proton-conducting transporter membrane subunit [Terriglobales bacterium]|nr:proton-conducting transporter membrane subunit [Terriglobales bacterium]